jgi:hypothetical protein
MYELLSFLRLFLSAWCNYYDSFVMTFHELFVWWDAALLYLRGSSEWGPIGRRHVEKSSFFWFGVLFAMDWFFFPPACLSRVCTVFLFARIDGKVGDRGTIEQGGFFFFFFFAVGVTRFAILV